MAEGEMQPAPLARSRAGTYASQGTAETGATGTTPEQQDSSSTIPGESTPHSEHSPLNQQDEPARISRQETYQFNVWWRAFEEILSRDLSDAPQFPGDPSLDIPNGLKYKYKGRQVSCNALFVAIEFCAGYDAASNAGQVCDQVPKGDKETKQLIRLLLDAKADHQAYATHAAGEMQAIHYAAGVGCVPALEALKEAHNGNQDAWQKTIDLQTFSSNKILHYTPLHDAVWFGREDTVRFLLEEKANPDVLNKEKWTPLTLVARGGYPRLVLPFVQHGAKLRSNKCVAPLVAAVRATQFPVDKLHLLANSCHQDNPKFIEYLQDVHDLAIENAQAAEKFVDILLGRDENEIATNEDFDDGRTKFMRSHWESVTLGGSQKKAIPVPSLTRSGSRRDSGDALKLRRDFARMVSWRTTSQEQVEQDLEAVNQMAAILQKAPRAGGDILEMLLDDPIVENRQHHPLPLRANLRSSGGVSEYMQYKYVDDVDGQGKGPCWKYDSVISKRPEWHEAFLPHHGDRNDDQEVRVKVFRMPHMLDTRIIRAMAHTEHKQLFALKSVQAIVNCLWHELVNVSVKLHCFLESVNVLMLLFWVFFDNPGWQHLCWSVLAGTVLREFVTWFWVLRNRVVLIGRSFSSYDAIYTITEAVVTCTLLLVVWMTRTTCHHPKAGWKRGCLATNFLLRWVRIMYMARSQPNLGPKIVCITKSFLPMREMILVALVLFWGFGFSSLLLNDDDAVGPQPVGEVLVNLLKALLLGDGESFDKMRELKGADAKGIFPHILVIIGSIAFTICVLNLFMAVYSNEYDNKSDLERVLFFQERANICFEALLQTGWPKQLERRLVSDITKCLERPQGKKVLEFLHRLLRADVVVVLVSLLMYAVSHYSLFMSNLCRPYTAAFAFAFAGLLLKSFTLRAEWIPPESGKRFYLWICYSRAVFEEAKSTSIEELRSEVASLKQAVLALKQPALQRTRSAHH